MRSEGEWVGKSGKMRSEQVWQIREIRDGK